MEPKDIEPENLKKGFDEARYYNDEQFELGGETYNASDDKEIQDSAVNILMRNHFAQIHVDVSHGELTIKGKVSDEEEKAKAESLLNDIPKIKKINNLIRLSENR